MEKFQIYDFDFENGRTKFAQNLHGVEFIWAPGQVKGKEGGGCGDENCGQVEFLLPHLQDLLGQLSGLTSNKKRANLHIWGENFILGKC